VIIFLVTHVHVANFVAAVQIACTEGNQETYRPASYSIRRFNVVAARMNLSG
jgi:hypothetical protein